MKPHKSAAEFEILTGWKEIASYLRAGVRTIQRYERERRLPVHRLGGRSRVTASKAELDHWLKSDSAQLDDRTMRLCAQANRNGVQFLQVEVELALTFSGLALKSQNRENRKRQSEAARKAYDTIMRLRHNLDLDATERDKLDADLHHLQSELRQLGEKL